jgi:hypothetical protein
MIIRKISLRILKSNRRFGLSALALLLLATAPGCGASPREAEMSHESSSGSSLFELPKAHILEHFMDPPNEYRLVQYQLNDRTLERYPRYGIGGFMGFFYKELYQQGPDARSKIGPWVEAANDLGMEVWLADDFGYPSGMAGGMVVQSNPEYEVRGLATRQLQGNGRSATTMELPAGAERFVSATLFAISADGSRRVVDDKPVLEDARVSTGGTAGDWELHAFFTVIRDTDVQAQSTMPQFRHGGRYPDLLNPDAIQSFLNYMHAEILSEIDDPASQVRGFYSNEPNLMQLHWSMTDGPFACVSWNADLPDTFQAMHGYDLLPRLADLFEGDDAEARRVRVHYHQTVAKMLTDSFARQIREWCNERGIASSGHFLLNEYLAMHVACYGDLMQFVAEFDVPALDIGIPNPDRFKTFPYEQTKFFSSIATWKERDSVICLLDPIIGGGGLLRLSPSIPLLKNATNWAFFHGANVFNAYLPLDAVDTSDARGRGRRAAGYSAEEYTAFNEYVGRIALVLRGARRETTVGLYYPITNFQAYYRPSNQHWSKMRPEFVRFQKPWDDAVARLIDADMDYNIIHPQAMEEATLVGDTLRIGTAVYRYLVMPQMEMLPKAVVDKLQAFESAGGTIIWLESVPQKGLYAAEDEFVRDALRNADPTPVSSLPSLISSSFSAAFDLRFSPGTDQLGVARFYRENQLIYFLMNKTESAIEVQVAGGRGGSVTLLDPTTGEVNSITTPHSMQLGALSSLLIIQ